MSEKYTSREINFEYDGSPEIHTPVKSSYADVFIKTTLGQKQPLQFQLNQVFNLLGYGLSGNKKFNTILKECVSVRLLIVYVVDFASSIKALKTSKCYNPYI